MEIDPPGGTALGQRMVDVRPIIQSRQVADQSRAPDRAPADVFNQAIVDCCFGSNHHGAARKLAVVKGQEQTGPAVDTLSAINPQRKRPAPETGKTDENGSLISQFPPRAETPRSHCRDVR